VLVPVVPLTLPCRLCLWRASSLTCASWHGLSTMALPTTSMGQHHTSKVRCRDEPADAVPDSGESKHGSDRNMTPIAPACRP
jgi:hypothetical protein